MRINKKTNWLHKRGLTKDEEEKIYDDNLIAIIENPRMWLNNLEYMHEYRVSWKNYTSDMKTPTMPKRFIKKKDI